MACASVAVVTLYLFGPRLAGTEQRPGSTDPQPTVSASVEPPADPRVVQAGSPSAAAMDGGAGSERDSGWVGAAPRQGQPEPSVGSEGYGPHIQRAHASGDPERSWAATRWLLACKTNADAAQVVERSRAQLSGDHHQAVTEMLERLHADMRRCQTVTEAEYALEPELAWAAMRGGIPGAAAMAAMAARAQPLDGTKRQELLAALQRDALAGDERAQIVLASPTASRQWGLGAIEQRAWRLVIQGSATAHELTGSHAIREFVAAVANALPAGLTEGEEARARELAERWATAAAAAAAKHGKR